MSSAIQPALDPSEVTPTLTEWRVSHYFADDVETYGESWTAEAAEEEEYYCRPFEVRCKCGVWGCGTQDLLERCGWFICIWGESCPQCTQRCTDSDMRPEDVLRPKVDMSDSPF